MLCILLKQFKMISLSKLDRLKQNQITLEPFYYIYKIPSKFHKHVFNALNYWLKTPDVKAKQIEEIMRMTHTLSLILDDIEDNSSFRYGFPSAHRVYGIGLTANAISHAIGIVFGKVIALNHPKAIKIFLDGYEEGHRGQGIELYWRDNFHCPTEEEYIDMLKQKSSIMLIIMIQLLQLFSKNTENYQNVAELIGVYISVRDDYCNLFNRECLKDLADNVNQKETNIVYGDSDITDGKFTLPIIHALNKAEKSEEITKILKRRTKDEQLINRCTSLLEEQGSAEYTEHVLRKLEQDIDKEITRLGGNPELTDMLKQLRNWRKGTT